jgi:hypothetical protein
MKITAIELTALDAENILTTAIESHVINYWALEYELIKIC